MNTLFRTIRVVAFAIAAQQLTPKEQRVVEEQRAKDNKQNLTGWHGIFFYCPTHEASNQALREVCEKTYRKAAFLAAAAKQTFTKAHTVFELAYISQIGEPLVLEIELFSTTGSPAAVHARVKAYVSYSKAVQTSPTMKGKGARMTPRSGDLIFWERETIGVSSGTAEGLVTDISNGIEQHLNEFFADYLNAQR